MGLFNKMKNFFSGFKYKLDREILREYLQHTIDFAVENKLPFCDEFYIADSLDAKDRLHVTILNYDVPGDAVYEIEKSFEGTGAFEEEWLFMLIPTITFVLMLVTKNVGRNIHLIWLAGWFVTQFLSHEWYTLFGRGFMGEMDKKIAYFSECIQLINVDGRYVPDVYHIVLHILIIIAFVVTLLYREEKTLVDEV